MYRPPKHGMMPLTFREGGGLLRQASWETHAHLEAQDSNSSEVVCLWRLTISQSYITSSAHPRVFLHPSSWTWECVDWGFILGEHTFSTLGLQPCSWVAEAHGRFWNAEPNQTSACSSFATFWIALSKFLDQSSPWCSQPLIWKETYKLLCSRILLALIWL